MAMRVFVTTNDRHLWILQAFAHLFNRYWSSLQPVVVAGYSRPDFELPPNFEFHQIAPENYPVERWSDGVIEFLRSVDDDLFVWMLEDMLLTRTVDVRAVATLAEYMSFHREIIRIDLTTDRLYAFASPGQRPDYEYYGSLDLVWSEPHSPYHLSLQAGIWRREYLLHYMVPGETPWELEMAGTERLSSTPEMVVLGTRQFPVRYSLALKSDRPMEPSVTGMRTSDYEELVEMGFLPGGCLT
jgi:hypothetical protein